MATLVVETNPGSCQAPTKEQSPPDDDKVHSQFSQSPAQSDIEKLSIQQVLSPILPTVSIPDPVRSVTEQRDIFVAESYHSIPDILAARGLFQISISNNDKHGSNHHSTATSGTAFTSVDRRGRETTSWTWEQIYSRADRIRLAILGKTRLSLGARVALIYRRSEVLDFTAAFYGTLMAGMTAVPINVIEEISDMNYILAQTRAELALTTEHNHHALSRDMAVQQPLEAKSSSNSRWPEGVTWWKTDTLARKRTKKSAEATKSAPETSFTVPELAYIEYTKSQNGELKGVAVSHKTILAQCRTIMAAFGSLTDGRPKSEQKEKEVVLSWLEPRQQVGLVMGSLLSVYAGNHTIYVQNAITENFKLWASCAARYKATFALGDQEGVKELLKNATSVDGRMGEMEQGGLEGLNAILVETVSISPLLIRRLADEILVDAPQCSIVPFCSLPEHGGMIISTGFHSKPSTMSMTTSAPAKYLLLDREAIKGNMIEVVATGDEAISRSTEVGVILLEAFENTVPQATMVIVDPETTILCPPETIGEIWIDSPSIPFGFWDLPQYSQETFHALPLLIASDGSLEPEVYDPVPAGFLRTGLVGGMMDGQLVVLGSMEDRILQEVDLKVEGMADEGEGDMTEFDCHYASDLVNTVLERIVGFTTCAAFECTVKGERLSVFCAETLKSLPGDLSRLAEYVQQAMVDYHGLHLYCVAIAAPGSLPRAYRNGRRSLVHPVLCRKMFEKGQLKLLHVQTLADEMVIRRGIAVGDDPSGGIWGAEAVMTRQGSLPAHARMVQYSSCGYPREILDERTKVDLSQFSNLAELLVWRSIVDPEGKAFVEVEERTSQGCGGGSSSVGCASNGGSAPHSGNGDPGVGITFRKFGMKVVNIAQHIEKRAWFKPGDRVVLLFPSGIEFAATVYACWMLGLVPVPVQLPESSILFSSSSSMTSSCASASFTPSGNSPSSALSSSAHEDILLLMGLLAELKGVAAMHLIGNATTDEFMKQKSTMALIKAIIGARQDAVVPTVLNVSKAHKTHKTLGKESGYSSPPRPSTSAPPVPAIVFVNYSPDMRRTLVRVSHRALMAQCRAIQVQCRLTAEKTILSCWPRFSGMGFLNGCALGIYIGAPTAVVQFSDYMAHPRMFFDTVDRHGVKDILLSHRMLEQGLAVLEPTLSQRGSSRLENLVLYSEGRAFTPDQQRLEDRLLNLRSSTGSWEESGGHAKQGHVIVDSKDDHLDKKRATAGTDTTVNSMFGHYTNPMVSTRAFMGIEPVRLYLSRRGLCRGAVEVTTKEKDPFGVWVQDSGIPICGTTVAIVNPETREICLSQEVGEIWVSSESNAAEELGPGQGHGLGPGQGQFDATLLDDTSRTSSTPSSTNSFSTTASGPSSSALSRTRFVRTGEIGFLWNYSNEMFNGGQATSLLFVLGSIGETFEVNGLMHFSREVERSVEGAHPGIVPGGSVIFQADQEAVVCVVEVRQMEPTMINMVLKVMHTVLEGHDFVPDVIAVVAEGVLPRNRNGEKQRGKMLSLFMSGRMPILYIHYPRGSAPHSIPEQRAMATRRSSLPPSTAATCTTSSSTGSTGPSSSNPSSSSNSSSFLSSESSSASSASVPSSSSVSTCSRRSSTTEGVAVIPTRPTIVFVDQPDGVVPVDLSRRRSSLGSIRAVKSLMDSVLFQRGHKALGLPVSGHGILAGRRASVPENARGC